LELSADSLVEGMDALYVRQSEVQRDLFVLIARADRAEVWRGDGAHDMAHWLWMRYGLSDWKARRWIAAAHALENLPRVSAAFSRGDLGIDKVVELTRLATPSTEAGLVTWARNVSSLAIRRRADLAVRLAAEVVRDLDRDRTLSWWYFDEGRRFALEAELPAAQGAVVAKALSRLADTLPVMPGEEGTVYADARRADALVVLASSRIARDPDPDRATVVVHASIDPLGPADPGFELEDGPAIPVESAARMMCTARVQTVIEEPAGAVIAVGRMTREPAAWMLRQLRHRDGGCTFPGCGSRRFVEAHHIVWWERGGSTDLDNLALVCFFHHKLVHEHGWRIDRGDDGIVRWYRPNGAQHEAGPTQATHAVGEPKGSRRVRSGDELNGDQRIDPHSMESGGQFMGSTVPWEVALAELGIAIRDRRLVRIRGP
jgi:hypothetical protein